MNSQVVVPREVLEGLLFVRATGSTNMLDVPMVVHICRLAGYDLAAHWINHHKSEYAKGVFKGFTTNEN